MNTKILEKCNLTFDVNKILAELTELYKEFNFDVEQRLNAGTDKDKTSQLGVNLTYPDLSLDKVRAYVGNDYYESSKYFGRLTGGYKAIKDAGVDSAAFTNTGDFFVGKYIGNVIEQVKNYHSVNFPNEPPVTRTFCAYLNPGAGFTFHRDQHTVCKYHIPIITNKWSFIYTDDGDNITATHLPADGQLWRLDTLEMHTAMNLSPNKNDYRMHIIFNVFK